jgi:hypothetical protein
MAIGGMIYITDEEGFHLPERYSFRTGERVQIMSSPMLVEITGKNHE